MSWISSVIMCTLSYKFAILYMCCIKLVVAACSSCDVIIYGLKAPRAEQLSDASWQITCDHNAASQRSSWAATAAAAAHNWVQSICVINSRRCPPQKSIDIASRRHKNAPLFVWALWLAIPIPLLGCSPWTCGTHSSTHNDETLQQLSRIIWI